MINGSGSLLERIGNTPLVELKKIIKWSGNPNVKLFAKLEFYNPGGSVKDRAAKNMLLQAIRRGELTKDKIILDSSSGNTGIAYAMIAAYLGYRLKLVMPENASVKRRIIEAYGAEVVITDPLEGSDGAILEAKKIYNQNPQKYYMPDQYNNPDNWKAHYYTTANEIWRDTAGTLTHFVAGIGTSGTLVGCSRRLKELNKDIKIIAVEPANAMHGLEGLKHMASSIVPSIYDEKAFDEKIQVETEEAYEMVCHLAREEGILAGFSSGAALFAAIDVARRIDSGNIVVIFPDGGDRYLTTPFWQEVTKYFEEYHKKSNI
ncbi:MAG: cysteine synthase family protein [bacterium]|nr:cysteine synthase family protein [bacterium]